MYFGGAPEMLQHRDSDRITIVATSSAQRLANLPDTPTIAEILPGFEVTTWLGFVAPRGTPPEIIAAMAQAARESLAVPEVAERLRSLGIVPVGSTPEHFAEVLRKDRALYVEAIRSAGIPLIEPAGQ
jgi:tripartite-type tricarboxylate transporter receptor subunit TctC